MNNNSFISCNLNMVIKVWKLRESHYISEIKWCLQSSPILIITALFYDIYGWEMIIICKSHKHLKLYLVNFSLSWVLAILRYKFMFWHKYFLAVFFFHPSKTVKVPYDFNLSPINVKLRVVLVLSRYKASICSKTITCYLNVL